MKILSNKNGVVEVDYELYDFLSRHIGNQLSEDEMPEGVSLYNFFENYMISGQAIIDLPKLTKNVLADWGDFYYWFEGIDTSPSARELVSFVDPAMDDFSYEDLPPINFFKSEEALKSYVIEFLLQDEEDMSRHGIYYSVIKNSSKKLYLLFVDIDCWGLGHCQNVDVVSKFEDIPGLC